MRINLKDWKTMEAAIDRIRDSIDAEWQTVFDLIGKYNNSPEWRLIMNLVSQIEKVREEAGMLMDCQPQREWLGGDSWKLREPHAVGLKRRYFTAEEVEEAKTDASPQH